ncbi:tripartite tricarboxylate transporter permease [Oleispirillum naphthae]|uniref:tripartite tricarboxylate transporter permease n=1 Tax=Oleispirillum naphthae TaxID=2838853 RepID=UPI00308243A9
MWEQYVTSFGLIATPQIILSIAAGVLGGMFIGAMPGLTSTMAIALLVPVTFGMDSVHGLALLMGVYCGAISGGFVASCLLNIPGTPSSAATCLDGYPMSKNGGAPRALALAAYSSVIGGCLSGLCLVIIAPTLADFALRFGPWEYFSLVIFTFSCVSSLSSGSMLKSFLAAGFGMMLALVGTDPSNGVVRFAFGFEDLESGFNVMPALIGVFAIPQLLEDVDEIGVKAHIIEADIKFSDFMSALKEIWERKVDLVRSTFIGIVIGILPGVGPGLSNVVAYAQARTASKHPEKFGQGVLAEAVIAPEAANNASMGGAMIPLLTLGIPGDASTLMMLGAFMLHNIQPGPLLFRDNGDIVYSIFIAYFIAFGFLLVFLHFCLKPLIKAIVTPAQFMIPVLLVLCTVGSYSLNNRMFDVYCFLGFGLFGYLLRQMKFPLLPVILGLILGHMAEQQLRLSLTLGSGSLLPFVTRPISLVLLVVSVVSLILPYVMEGRQKKRSAAAAAADGN